MASRWPTLPRTIVEQPRFVEERDALADSVVRWDNAMKGVTYAIAHDPRTAGQETYAEDVYGVATEPFPDAPNVVVFYTFDDENVYLESVIGSDPQP